MSYTASLFALFTFGLAITGIVVLGVVRAREYEARSKKVIQLRTVRSRSKPAA